MLTEEIRDFSNYRGWLVRARFPFKDRPDIARQLHDSINDELAKGASEATFIASKALQDLGY
jgi:hypothetical protein